MGMRAVDVRVKLEPIAKEDGIEKEWDIDENSRRLSKGECNSEGFHKQLYYTLFSSLQALYALKKTEKYKNIQFVLGCGTLLAFARNSLPQYSNNGKGGIFMWDGDADIGLYPNEYWGLEEKEAFGKALEEELSKIEYESTIPPSERACPGRMIGGETCVTMIRAGSHFQVRVLQIGEGWVDMYLVDYPEGYKYDPSKFRQTTVSHPVLYGIGEGEGRGKERTLEKALPSEKNCWKFYGLEVPLPKNPIWWAEDYENWRIPDVGEDLQGCPRTDGNHVKWREDFKEFWCEMEKTPTKLSRSDGSRRFPALKLPMLFVITLLKFF